MIGWDHPDTARYYGEFLRRHRRYQRANRALVRQAGLRPGQRVLDFAAGSGATTVEALGPIGAHGRVDCVEPAAAMRAAGRSRFDGRVRWLEALPDRQPVYDRILCGAGIWQVPDLAACIRELAARLVPGGALCFNIPAAYLGLADRPGGGSDPWLVGLPAALAGRHAAPLDGEWIPLTIERVEMMLREAGLAARRWSHRARLSQAEYRDWLKVPVVSNGLLGQLDADDRAAQLDAVFESVDQAAWRWERWIGWTAAKPEFPSVSLSATPAADAAAVRRRAEQEGYVYAPRLLPAAQVVELRRWILRESARSGLTDAEGRWRGGAEPFGGGAPERDAGWLALQQRVFACPAFQALGSEPRLVGLLEQLLQQPVVSQLGSACRLVPPNAPRLTTPPHRDQDYVRGVRALWIAWIPLGRCPVGLGPLAVAPGSHREPLVQPTAKVEWATNDLEPGDVLFFSGRTLHRACPNLSRDRVRLSVDFRFGAAP